MAFLIRCLLRTAQFQKVKEKYCSNKNVPVKHFVKKINVGEMSPVYKTFCMPETKKKAIVNRAGNV